MPDPFKNAAKSLGLAGSLLLAGVGTVDAWQPEHCKVPVSAQSTATRQVPTGQRVTPVCTDNIDGVPRDYYGGAITIWITFAGFGSRPARKKEEAEEDLSTKPGYKNVK